jgi:ferredoxin
MSIKIDKEACIGCGLCEALCPQNFKLNDEAKAEVVSQEMNDSVQEAKDNCPTAAIIID